MGFSLLRWKKSGRDWSRGEPPPRGSAEYCGVPEVFQPPASRATSSGARTAETRPAASPPPPAAGTSPRPAAPAPAKPAAPPAAPAPAKPVAPPATSAGPPAKGGSGVAWLLGMAGVSYLGWKWLERRGSAAEQEDDGAGEGGDVVVVEPGDVVHVAGDQGSDEVYSDGEPGEETEHGS